MSPRWFAIVVSVCVLLAGCRNPWVSMEFDLLHRELREKEDLIYDLQHQLQKKYDQLESFRKETGSLHEQEGPPPADGDSGSDDTGELKPPPVLLDGSPDDNLPLELTRPQSIELPLPGNREHRPDAPGGDQDVGDGVENSAQGVGLVDAHVTHVVINRSYSGGLDLDGRPGNDGLRVVLEPRNADGQFVALAGPVSVVALDPQKQGEQARVARWDLPAVDAARAMHSNHEGRGIFLELVWPDERPEHDQLQVFVQYETVDGRKIQTNQSLDISLTGQISARWTPFTKSTNLARRNRRGPEGTSLGDDDRARRLGVGEGGPQQTDSKWRLPDSSILLPPQRPTAPAIPIDQSSRQVDRRPFWRPYR